MFVFFFWNPHRGNLWVNHSWMDIIVAGPGLGEPRSGVATVSFKNIKYNREERKGDLTFQAIVGTRSNRLSRVMYGLCHRPSDENT